MASGAAIFHGGAIMERMKRLCHLEVHDVTLETEGPLFVGDGRQLAPHMLVQLPDDAGGVYVLAQQKLAPWLAEHGLLETWAAHVALPQASGTSFFAAAQALDVVPALAARRLALARPIDKLSAWQPFLRRPDGTAYLPGSTLKGCIATAFLVWQLNELPQQERARLADQVRAALAEGTSAPEQLVREALFHRLFINPLDDSDPRNSFMRTFSFDDSAPIADVSFFLAARDDYGARGAAAQPVWREAVRPGSVIRSRLTIDLGMMSRSRSMLTVLNEALGHWQLLQERVYHDRIRVPNRAPIDRRALYVYLGGGAGFVNKTILYALFERDEARTLANELLSAQHESYRPEWGKETAPYNRHMSDIEDDRRLAYDVGKCRITVNY